MGKGRTPCCEKGRVKRGPWSQAEDLKLISFIHKHGHNNWRSLPKLAGLARCGKSCRLRWVNYLRPDVKRGNFTPDEEDTIIRLQQSLGNRWSKIASHLPGRTDNEIKNVWNTHLKKKRLFNSNNNNSTDNNTDEDDDDSQLQQQLNDINTTTVSSHAQPQQQLTSPSSANLTDDLIKTTSSTSVPPPPCFMDISYGTIEISTCSRTTTLSTCSRTTTPNPHDNHNKPEASVNFPYLDESNQLVDLWDSFSLDYNHTSEDDHLEQMITTNCMTTTAAYDQLDDGFRENYIVSCGGGDGDHNLHSSSTGTDHFGLELLASSPPIVPTADSEDTFIETYNLPWPSSPYLL